MKSTRYDGILGLVRLSRPEIPISAASPSVVCALIFGAERESEMTHKFINIESYRGYL